MRLHYLGPALLGHDHSPLEAGERWIERLAGGAWLLISDTPPYEEKLIKPQGMNDVEILGRCEIRTGRVL